ncbi:MAG: Gfo/Idh/MocA family oxidoreductase [bacterium]
MNSKNWSRRDILKVGGLIAMGAPLSGWASKQPEKNLFIPDFKPAEDFKPDRPITAVVLGAGNRGNVYAGYSKQFPDELKIIGVAEPIEFRRKRFAKEYEIPEDRQWTTWEDALGIAKFADVLIITTPDNLHYDPAMHGLILGYDLLLEKPISQSWDECEDIKKLAGQKNNIIGICHVLRYTAYFRKMKEIIESGILGDVVSIQHFEPINHIHMSHSYVRGNWRNEKESNPILLAKSCHDLDILYWMTGKKCTRVSSFGALNHFKSENAPEDSTSRCADGCKVEKDCPYSALKIYHRDRTYLHHFDFVEGVDQGEQILRYLKEGQYGRCVYHCDNDVLDHQVVLMEFEGNVSAAFSMEAFTSYHGRKTRIMGTMGDIVGDMETMTVTNFRNGEVYVWDANKDTVITSGHGGGDYGLMHDFIRAVSKHDESMLTSNLAASMESHFVGFKAEESRLFGSVVDVNRG